MGFRCGAYAGKKCSFTLRLEQLSHGLGGFDVLDELNHLIGPQTRLQSIILGDKGRLWVSLALQAGVSLKCAFSVFSWATERWS